MTRIWDGTYKIKNGDTGRYVIDQADRSVLTTTDSESDATEWTVKRFRLGSSHFSIQSSQGRHVSLKLQEGGDIVMMVEGIVSVSPPGDPFMNLNPLPYDIALQPNCTHVFHISQQSAASFTSEQRETSSVARDADGSYISQGSTVFLISAFKRGPHWGLRRYAKGIYDHHVTLNESQDCTESSNGWVFVEVSSSDPSTKKKHVSDDM